MTTLSEQTHALLAGAFRLESPPHLTARTAWELDTMGIGSTMRTRLVRQNVIILLARGVYVLASHWHNWSRKTRCLAKHYAVTKAHPTLVLSHASAALWWGCPELELPEKVYLSAVSDTRSHVKFVKIHKNRRQLLENSQVYQGVSVTSPQQTIVDCASTLSPLQSLCIADSFLHRNLCTLEDLSNYLLSATGQGASRRQLIAQIMSPFAESPAESIARFYLYQWRLPRPQEQRELWINGRKYRPDFVWEEYKLILEVDGEVKYSGEFGDPHEVIRHELKRQRELERAGWRVIRVRWAELMNSPETLRRALIQEMQEARRLA